MDGQILRTRGVRFSFLHDTIITTFAGHYLDHAACVADGNLISIRLH
jgi:hypothetical protein